jgi:BNR repeat-like domain/F5/8 type C domain
VAVAPPSATEVGLGGQTTVASGLVDPSNLSGTADFMQFPFAASLPSPSGGRGPRVVMLSYSEQVDSGAFPERLRTLRSVDGGRTFAALATDVPINSMAQLTDGSLVAVNFRTASPTTTVKPPPAVPLSVPTTSTPPAPPPGGGSTVFATKFWRSHDYGTTWDQHAGTISAPDSYDAVYFHRGILAARDGSLLATTYGYLDGDPKYRSMLARSTDGGTTWRIVSTIATTPAGATIEGRSEPTMARAANGDLVVLMRQSAPINPAVCTGSRQGSALVMSRSSNDGSTWSPAVSPVGPGIDVYNVSSADPSLMTMPGGQLVLSYGRPANKMIVSTDGNGTTWSAVTVTDSGTSSGYTSIVALSENSALQMGDFGSNWCFPAGTPIAKVGIWSKTIGLRPADTKRIDLRSRYLSGSLKVATNLTDQRTAAAGPAAAIDGSTDPASVAVRYANDGYYQIDLGSPNALTGASIALPHAQASAAIDLSNDGVTWRIAAAAWPSSGQYRSLTDRPFPAGTAARFVRVRVTDVGGVSALGEVQVRTNASTFEDDLIGAAPQGFVVVPTWAPLVTVAAGGVGLSSDRAVRLDDTSSATTAVMAIAEPQGATRNLELAVRSNRIAAAILISVDGRRGSTSQVGLHLGIFPDGSLRRWTGSSWMALSSPGLVNPANWAGVRINANLSGALVYVNGRPFSRIPLTPGTTALTGIEVSSGGTKSVGDDFFIDQFRAS